MSGVKWSFFIVFAWAGIFSQAWGAQLMPENVAVVYNANSSHGRELALEYMHLRNIPDENLVVLFCPDKEEITRDEYKGSILEPLRQAGREKNWWAFSGRSDKPFSFRKIHALVLISGVPLKISHAPERADEKLPLQKMNNASVDSELMLMPVDGIPMAGWLDNPYYGKDQEFAGTDYPLVLVTRLDSPAIESTKRMMRDAVTVEKKGLWGWAVVDVGGPHAEGDKWLNATAELAERSGFPLLVDRWNETLPLNYPLMNDVAVYWGWYTQNVNGPFAAKDFRFKPGAVAAHIHSFSAGTLKSSGAGWAGPLVERGAAVSLGNVYEPFLGPSQHLDVFFDRLLKGYTVAEAAGMSLPVLSWQTVVLGDPLYRPFGVRATGAVPKNEGDKLFQAWWQAGRQWDTASTMRHLKMEDAARTVPGGGFFWEALAYEALRTGDVQRARDCLRQAGQAATTDRDKIRIAMELANILRTANADEIGCKTVLENLMRQYPGSPYAKAVDEWLKRLNAPNPGK